MRLKGLFYPYIYDKRGTLILAKLDYQNSMKSHFNEGSDIADLPSFGIDETVPKEKITEFARIFLANTKDSGLQELSKLFEIKEEGGITSYQLKKRELDYYIVGFHSPVFYDKSNLSNQFRFVATTHIFLFSLGTIPFWQSDKTWSTFFIYDNKLNLIGSKIYENEIEIISGWWGNREEGNILERVTKTTNAQKKIFVPQVQQFSDEFPSIIEAY